ncbi:MAG TPA: ROK family protein [Rubricoccaceae bacterium]|jgi:glucokinase
MPDGTAFAVGVDLGGTNLKVALVDRDGAIVHRLSVPTDADGGTERVLDRIADGIARVAGHLPDGARLLGVGIGAPGTVALDRATVPHMTNFPGWERVHLPDRLRPRLDQRTLTLDGPILADNDANVAGLGSAHYGAGHAYGTFLMVTLGTGVGGAIVIDRRVFRGTTGAAGEIGHISVDYDGPYSRAGVAGAAEAYLGQRYLSEHARDRLRTRPTSLYATAGADLENLTPHALTAAAEAGDAAAAETLAWAGHKLGCALASAVNLLDIRTVVVGGGVSAAGDWILEPARDALRRSVMPAMRDGLKVVQETRGNDVALLGAACLVFHDAEA